MRAPFDTIALSLLVSACLVILIDGWLRGHPGDNPWAPLTLEEPRGWATGAKLARIRAELPACRALLDRSGLAAVSLPASGETACRRDDRQRLTGPSATGIALVPSAAEATCAVNAALAWWTMRDVQPVARALFGRRVVRIEHLGTANCRRIAGSDRWSEHATGNAIDVSAFVLASGQRISVARDWSRRGPATDFLHAVRDRACGTFATVLSPDYNRAHVDHIHLDQGHRPGAWSTCR